MSLRWKNALNFTVAVLTLAAVACGGAAPSDDATPDELAQAGGGKADGLTSLTDPVFASGDAATLGKVLRGTLRASDGMQQIAWSQGFPIKTARGYLVARVDDGRGPYTFEGDSSGWRRVAMANSHGVWWALVAVPRPANARYKFVTRGGDDEADPSARRFGYDDNGEYSLVAASGAHLERWPGMGSARVEPRTVRVWVPSGRPTHHLYLHDGQNLFDPDAMSGGWRLQDSLGSTTLAIGIDNTPARMDEYTHVRDRIDGEIMGGRGDDYADFVDGVVRPFIEKQYGKARKVGVLGSSLGGLISLEIALRKPGRYDFAGSMSGTLGWGSMGMHEQTMIERYRLAGHQKTALYVDSGGDDGGGCVDSDHDGVNDDNPDAGDNYCESRQMADVLASSGYRYDVDLWHWHEPGAEHNEADWSARVYRPIGYFEAM